MMQYLECINDTDLAYTCDPCVDAENGRVRSLCLIKPGTVLPSPLTLQAIELLIARGLMYVMPYTAGLYDGGTPKYGTGYGDDKEKLLGADYVATVKDPNYIQNRDFWATVEKVETWNIALRTDTKLIVSYDDVSVTVKNPIEEGIDSEVVWSIECKWFSKNKPAVIDYPAHLFDGIFKTYEYITGLTIPENSDIHLTVNTDKVCYVYKVGANELLTSTAGVISETNTDGAMAVVLIVPNNTTTINCTTSDFAGEFVYKGTAQLYLNNSIYITSVISNNNTVIDISGCEACENLEAEKVGTLLAVGCALTAKSIGDALYAAYLDEREDISYDCSGGTSAIDINVSAYILSEYGIAGNDVISALFADGGLVNLNY